MRNQAGVVPAVEPSTLAREHCVDDPVLLTRVRRREHPLQLAAEVEQADSIALVQILGDE